MMIQNIKNKTDASLLAHLSMTVQEEML